MLHFNQVDLKTKQKTEEKTKKPDHTNRTLLHPQ